MDFKMRLRNLREKKKINQNELAEFLNLQASAISKYEKGLTQPSMSSLIKMADFFECSVDYLVGISDFVSQTPSAEFSSKEVNIILKYRLLSKENQIRVDERINAMIDKANDR